MQHLAILRLIVFLCFCLSAFTALAQDAQVPVISGKVIRDFARITFEWPEPAYLSASAKGNIITVSFDRHANPDTNRMLKALAPYISSAEVTGGGKSMRITMKKSYRIRSFVSGSVSGIDILQINAKEQAVEADLDPQTDAGARAHMEKKEKTALEKKPAKENIKEAKKAKEKAAKPAPEQPALQKETPEQTETATPPAPEPLTDAEGVAKRQEKEKQEELKQDIKTAATNSGFHISANRTTESFNITFPWAERVAAAAFIRGGYFWVVFNKPATAADFADIGKTLSPHHGKVSQIKQANMFILRIPKEEFQGIELSKPAGESWKLSLLPLPNLPVKNISAESNAEAAQAYVLIPALETDQPVTLTDPDVGDELLVVPFYHPGEGVGEGRTFVDFDVLQSAQGAAIQKKSDDVHAIIARNGIRISTEKGATLSKGLPPVSALAPAVVDKGKTLFPYAQWMLPADQKRGKYLQSLQADIVAAATPSTQNEKRMRLAQFYLSEGLASEALAVLRQIRRTDAAFYTSRRLAALSGAANFLMYRFSEAAEDFAARELDDMPEIAYWRAMLADLLGSPDQVFDYMANRKAYIDNYPPLMRQRLAILAADRAVEAKAYNTALTIFDELNKDNMIAGIEDYTNYLMGKISVETGKREEGMQIWQNIIDEKKNSFVRARAEYSMIIQQLDKKKITPDEAINRLELLNLSWRGDNLELSVLNKLGELYTDKKDWVNALRVWRAMNAGFPNTELSLQAYQKMTDAFITIFDSDTPPTLTTLEQVVLFNEYSDLNPSNETGDRIIDRLTDRMIDLDLLDQTAAMLETRMRFRLDREARSKAGTKLARIYILNHQPELAMKALASSAYGDNPEEVKKERNYLTAKAFIGLKQYANAMQLLVDDKSPEAGRIRLEAYWDQKDWPNIVTSLENILKERRDPGAPLTAEQAKHVTQLALAYVAESDTAQLGYLRDYFMPLMEGNQRKTVFEYLTRPDMPLNPANFDAIVKSLSDTKQVLDTVKPKDM